MPSYGLDALVAATFVLVNLLTDIAYALFRPEDPL